MNILLFSCVLSFTNYKRRNARKKKLWQENISTIISEAIFFEDDQDEWADITNRIQKLMQKAVFRNNLIDELIQARKNLSGVSTLNLEKLYNVLQLDKDSLKKLNSSKWHVLAKGVQEMSLMGQIKHVKRIYKLTNNKNELVRSEAQSALVSFYGFSGLRFLNIVTHPISNWQQIQLLNKLKDASVKNFEHHKKWLQSPVESVKVFALKLATCYSCHDMYVHVIECLHSTSMQVQLSALAYLKKMPLEDTAAEVVTSYAVGNKTYKIAVLEALGSIANEREISFLFQQLHNNDVDLKMAAANALSCLHTSGTIFLKADLFADGNPWKNSLLHLKKEIAA